jgi:hypothetical protein
VPRPATAARDPGSTGPRVGLGALVVDLVRDEHDRLAGAAQQAHDSFVVVGGTHGGVDDEQHGVGEVDGDLGLLGHPQVDAAGVDGPAAGVDEGEAPAEPLGVVGDAVAGHAGHVLDDGLAPPMMRLTRVDLPTLGRPMIAATGSALHREPRRALIDLGDVSATAGAFGEHPDRSPARQHRAGRSEGRTVPHTPIDGDLPDPAQQGP